MHSGVLRRKIVMPPLPNGWTSWLVSAVTLSARQPPTPHRHPLPPRQPLRPRDREVRAAVWNLGPPGLARDAVDHLVLADLRRPSAGGRLPGPGAIRWAHKALARSQYQRPART